MEGWRNCEDRSNKDLVGEGRGWQDEQLPAQEEGGEGRGLTLSSAHWPVKNSLEFFVFFLLFSRALIFSCLLRCADVLFLFVKF